MISPSLRLAAALALSAAAAAVPAQDATPTAPPAAATAAAPALPDVTLPANATATDPAATPTQPSASAPTSPVAQDAPAPASTAQVLPATQPQQPTSTPQAQPSTTQAATQAEQDYEAIYGNQEYNPVADSTLPPPAELPVAFDPWEKWNRKVHRFNNAVDRGIAKPLAKAYVAVVPRIVRLGVGNFFNNLSQPLSALNALLQGRPKQAAQAIGRFALNTTLGIGGLFDPASDAHLPNHGEDFGQTLGVWGWQRSRYVELPLLGPRTVRDLFGMSGDAPLALLHTVEDDKLRLFLQGLQLVDVRTQLFAVDSMREGAADDYALVRDAWLQRRNYQINGDRRHQQDPSLPDYLQDDTDSPGVPADAVPVQPMPGG